MRIRLKKLSNVNPSNNNNNSNNITNVNNNNTNNSNPSENEKNQPQQSVMMLRRSLLINETIGTVDMNGRVIFGNDSKPKISIRDISAHLQTPTHGSSVLQNLAKQNGNLTTGMTYENQFGCCTFFNPSIKWQCDLYVMC